MTELKCPFCQQKLKEVYCNGICMGLVCKNVGCPETKSTLGNKALWHELILAHNALIVALKGLDDIIDSGSDGYWTAIKTKEQIMALKQKEQKK
jgi:hypothetical protein